MKLSVVCLSLRRTADRRARFEAEARRTGLSFEFWDAPDARDLTPAALATLADQDMAQRRFGRRLGVTEIACAEGHRQIYRRLVEGSDDAVVVFEDDVDLGDRVVDVVNALAGFDEEVGQRREIYLIGGCRGYESYPLWLRRRRPRPVTPDHSLLRVVRSARALHGTFSYVITRAAARAILESEPVISTIPDPWDLLLAEKTLDDVWILDPPVAVHERESSQSMLEAERQAIEADTAHRRLAKGIIRRAALIVISPGRLFKSVAYRLGWRRVKRVAYEWLSWMP